MWTSLPCCSCNYVFVEETARLTVIDTWCFLNTFFLCILVMNEVMVWLLISLEHCGVASLVISSVLFYNTCFQKRLPSLCITKGNTIAGEGKDTHLYIEYWAGSSIYPLLWVPEDVMIIDIINLMMIFTDISMSVK